MAQIANPATWLAGYIPDLPTPFDANDRIDFTAFAKLLERQIETGGPTAQRSSALGDCYLLLEEWRQAGYDNTGAPRATETGRAEPAVTSGGVSGCPTQCSR